MRRIKLVALWMAVISGAATAAYSSPINLASRSILVGQIGFPTTNTVEQFTPTGGHSNSLLLGFSGLAESLAVINGRLFVSDSSGTVRRIDPATGNVISSFGTGTVGLTGLGTFGANLLTLSFNSSQVNVYSPGGALQTSIRLATTPPRFSWNGVTSDGQSLFLADFASGTIYNYSLVGSQIGFFQTGLLGISGVAYDLATNSLWAANSPLADTASRGVYNFSTAGALLGSFSTPTVAPSAGIAVTGSVVPEPTLLLLMGTALGGVAARVRRRRFAVAGALDEQSLNKPRSTTLAATVAGTLEAGRTPEGEPSFHFSANRTVTFAPTTFAVRDDARTVEGSLKTTVPMPGPNDVFSFELPALRIPGGAPVPDRLSDQGPLDSNTNAGA